MKKVLMLLANGFEDTEAITTRDVLLRGGIQVVCASLNNTLEVVSSFNSLYHADSLLENESLKDYDGIILPGGKRGVDNIFANEQAKLLVKMFADKNKLIAAICAAPSIVGRLGLLNGIDFTCYTGFENGYEGNYTGAEVEIDRNFITARSMYYSQNFGLAIIEYLLGSEIKAKIYNQICSKY